MTSWENIWSKRVSEANPDTLTNLISLDGFDSSVNKISAESWLEYVFHVSNKAGITNEHSVFEVGCGSGAFLYPLHSRLRKFGGLDYSKVLIDIAKKTMPEGDFSYCAAHECNTDDKYDFVIANSVFHYFSGYDYAENVLLLMLEKANLGLVILELPNWGTKSESELSRRGALEVAEYEEKYKNLQHLYYPTSFFENFALKHHLAYSVTEQSIEGYSQSAYRFNCYLNKI